jgi:hypothetical protein
VADQKRDNEPDKTRKTLKENQVISRLKSGAGGAPTGLISYVGLTAQSSRPGYWVLYLTLDMSRSVEIREEDIVHSEELPPERSPFGSLGGTRVFVRQDAQVTTSTVTSRTQDAASAADEFDLDIRLGAPVAHAPCIGTSPGTTCLAECGGGTGAGETCLTCVSCGGSCRATCADTCRTFCDTCPGDTCGRTCNTCRTQCGDTCATCATRCGTCNTCATQCGTCNTCATQCGTCQTQCNQATCQTCRTQCDTCPGDTCRACTHVTCFRTCGVCA